jgi:hypothetical protein
MYGQANRSIIALAINVAFGFGCASTLPRQRPVDLTVTMMRDSGVASPGQASSDTLVLAPGQSRYQVLYGGGGAVSVPLDVDDADLDALYEVLLDVGFIELSNGYTLEDVGSGTWILVHWAGTDYIAHPGDEHMGEKWMQGWEQVVDALKKVRKVQVNDKGIEVPATFDAEIFGTGYKELKSLE